MPAAGKSTIGVILAKTLGFEFIDTDLIIQKQTGRLLQEIIDNDGLDHFCICEERAVMSVKNKEIKAESRSALIERAAAAFSPLSSRGNFYPRKKNSSKRTQYLERFPLTYSGVNSMTATDGIQRAMTLSRSSSGTLGEWRSENASMARRISPSSSRMRNLPNAMTL